MNIKPIKNEKNYTDTLSYIKSLMNAEPNTPQMDELEVLTTLVEAYEEQHYKIEDTDPIEAITFRVEQEGLKQKELDKWKEGVKLALQDKSYMIYLQEIAS